MSKPSQKKGGHAIVIGGGTAGLLACRILLNHFEQVTLIERDSYPKDPVFRPGVPQSRQLHTCLLRGQQVLETLFPGMREKLLAQGAVWRAYGHESLYFYGDLCPKLPPVLQGWNCSRMLLEWQIRQELSSEPNLQILEGFEVVHLLAAKDRAGVSGVQYRLRSHVQSDLQELQGELVVDASGASSHIQDWLRELGYEIAKEIVVDAPVGYATRFYEVPAHFPYKGIAIQQNQQSAALMEIEGGRFLTVLTGRGQDVPPTDDKGYLEFARSLPVQLSEAMQMASPISPIYGYRWKANRLRCFEQLRRWPEGLLVVGDAVCCVNPTYGQGMTVAALEALMLEECLHKNPRRKNFAQHFQRKVARIVAFPWRLARAGDRRPPEEERRKGLAERYTESLMALLPRDEQVLLTFLETVHMIRSPLSLFSPPILVKVLRQSLTLPKQ